MAKKKRRSVALAYELDSLALALEGTIILAELAANDDLSTQHQHARAPRCVHAILELVHERLRQVRVVVRGDADAASIWTESNDAGGAVDGVVLKGRDQ